MSHVSEDSTSWAETHRRGMAVAPKALMVATPRQLGGGGSLLARRRRELLMSQHDLAARLAVNHATVSRWETGQRRPPQGLLPALSATLRVSVQELVSSLSEAPELRGDTVGRVPGLGRALRDFGISEERAADACGVDVDRVVEWTQRRFRLPRSAAEALAQLTGLSVAEFVARVRVPPTSRAADDSPLRSIRRAQLLTLDAVALRVGVCASTVGHWEKGRATPPPHRVFQLARVLRTDPRELAAGMEWSIPLGVGVECEPDLDCPEKLSIARIHGGLSRSQLARCVGVTSPTVGAWEEGRTQPRGAVRKRLYLVLRPPGGALSCHTSAPSLSARSCPY